ncbi:MAG: hypothetical protein AAFV53_32510, partial [Myxococcota bacterium]
EAEVVSVSTDLITVKNPSVPEWGTAPVTVEQGAEGGVYEPGFLYLEDGTGKAGVIGVMQYFETTGEYWVEDQTGGGGGMVWLLPVDFHWWELSNEMMDTCAKDDYTTDVQLFVLPVEQDTLSASADASTRVSYTFDSATYFFDADVFDDSNYEPNTRYDLGTFDGGVFEGVGVERLFRTSRPISVSNPDISGFSQPLIDDDQTFLWEEDGFDWVEIRIQLVADNGSIEDQFTCVAQDDGRFELDPSMMVDWPLNRQVFIWVGGVRETNAPLSFNNAESRVSAIHQLVGAGIRL